MIFFMDILQTLFRYAGIDLRSSDAGVAEHFLDRAQVGAALQQMCGKGMAQQVRRKFGHAYLAAVFLDQFP